MIAVVGAGAVGSALAIVHARAGERTALLGTRFDGEVIQAVRSGGPHPALGITLDPKIDARPWDAWGAVLANAQRVVIGVSTDGLVDVVSEIAPRTHPRATWVLATKGWDATTLQTPAHVVGSAIGDEDRVVVLAGPALAPEVVAGAPTSMVVAAKNAEVAAPVVSTLEAAGVFAVTTDDVVGAEAAAGYKNVTAIAVGMCEGLSEGLPERVYVHRYANARAAMFALGLRDMSALAVSQGGRSETILGLAGAGDLYVTCLGGRNGNFGRLLGSGHTPDQAQATIGSTVEGVANTTAVLTIAERQGVELPAARAVASVLSGDASPGEAITTALRSAS